MRRLAPALMILLLLPAGLRAGQIIVPSDPRKGLEMAILDLKEQFGDRYPDADRYLERLDALPANDSLGFVELQRQALLSSPPVTDHPILFVTHNQYRSKYHAVDMLFHTGEFNWDFQVPHWSFFEGGSQLKCLDAATGQVRTLLDASDGLIRDPDVYFDGSKLLFAMRRNMGEDYNIYEMNIDGTGLRQITSLEGVSDYDPVYLPDDRIIFSSTREPKYNKCSRDHAANMYRMDADGANIHRITRNTLFDHNPEILPDGRILYARWEYIDRNFGDAHGVWTVNPDGTGQALYYGNNTAIPPAVYDPHLIPGTNKMVGIIGNHHSVLNGAFAIINRSEGVEGKEPILLTYPEVVREISREGGGFDCDIIERIPGARYEDPWPLSENFFLCSREKGSGDSKVGIYLIDVFGNQVLLHEEEISCFDPMPVRSRPRPAVIPDNRKYDNSPGIVYLQNVYEGTHMQGVEPGSAKYLRIVESPQKKNWSAGTWEGQGYHAPGMNWHDFSSKRILGTVPIQDDGSAYFEVPSDTFIYYQVLDSNKMMIQSMRSGTVVQAGEVQGCIGCHEDRLSAPRPMGSMPKAMRMAPSKIEEWYGPSRKFSYTREVQPVFDRNCVQCHDFDKPAGERLVLAGDRNPFFNASYIDLNQSGTRAITVVGGGPAEIQQPRSWGSHASLLTTVVTGSHPSHDKIELTTEEKERIFTWLDLNAPYYPTYETAYPKNPGGRSPINQQQFDRLLEITGYEFPPMRTHGRRERALISFERPELSPCLKKVSDPELYAEALEIIKAGQKTLEQTPRCDMEGFVPCAMDRLRLKRFDDLDGIEQEFRRAIAEGRKMYDRDVTVSVIPPVNPDGDGNQDARLK